MDYVLPERPIQVAAHGSCHVAGSTIENIAYIVLKFADHKLAHFHVNWLAPAQGPPNHHRRQSQDARL